MSRINETSAAAIPFDYIDEATVARLLSWPLVYHAVEQALLSVVVRPADGDQRPSLPKSVLKPRIATNLPDNEGMLFTMPGYIANYTAHEAATSAATTTTATLGCKMVTLFQANPSQQPPLPSIAATIVLFDPHTGALRALLQATHITTWRTVAASLVATRHLYFERREPLVEIAGGRCTLAIIGCGVEGRAHAIAMATMFPFTHIRLWNRTAVRATNLRSELLALRDSSAGEFQIPTISIETAATVAECVRDADVIVTATYAAAEPLIEADMLTSMRRPNGVHLNAIGAGPAGHFNELASDVYETARIYCDSRESAAVELAAMPHPIVGQVGDVVAGVLGRPSRGERTVFQALGIAVEDCAVAQAVYDLYKQKQSTL